MSATPTVRDGVPGDDAGPSDRVAPSDRPSTDRAGLPDRQTDVDRTARRQVVRRDGTTSPFDASKIAVALTKAFLAVEGTQATDSARVHETVAELTDQVVASLTRHPDLGLVCHIEDIQDQVELALMRSGHHRVARAYVLYREEHARARLERDLPPDADEAAPSLQVKGPDGELRPLDTGRLTQLVEESCAGLPATSATLVLAEVHRNLYDGITLPELELALVMAARTFVETDPDYTFVSARLLLDKLRREALTFVSGEPDEAGQTDMAGLYPRYFRAYVERAVRLDLLDPELERFDLERLGAALHAERDLAFQFLGLQTLYDRYLLHSDGTRFELPQAFFMRVAMGLALREDDRETRAIEFYELLSSFDFMCSTPTLFNAGTRRPQLSSCFLTTVADDLDRSSRASRTTRCCRSTPAGSATTGRRCAAWAPTSRARTAARRAWCRSSRSPTTPRSPSTRAGSGRAPPAPTSRPGTSTSRSSSTCARTPATSAVVPTT